MWIFSKVLPTESPLSLEAPFYVALEMAPSSQWPCCRYNKWLCLQHTNCSQMLSCSYYHILFCFSLARKKIASNLITALTTLSSDWAEQCHPSIRPTMMEWAIDPQSRGTTDFDRSESIVWKYASRFSSSFQHFFWNISSHQWVCGSFGRWVGRSFCGSVIVCRTLRRNWVPFLVIS